MNFSVWFSDYGCDGVRDCILVAPCLLSTLLPWMFMNSHFAGVSAAPSQSCVINRRWEGHMRRSSQGEFTQSPVEGNSSLEMDGNAMNEHRKLRLCSTHTCMRAIRVWKWIFIALLLRHYYQTLDQHLLFHPAWIRPLIALVYSFYPTGVNK